MEEGQNRIKLVNEDRISALPDCLLLEILSLLASTKSAIRTGALSKRWKHLWTFLPSLCFYDDIRSPYDFVSSVDKTLTQCRQSKLNKFRVDTFYDFLSDSQYKNWIRYAITRKVEELNFRLWQPNFKAGLLLDESFFINPYFTDLTLEGCMLNSVGAISWKNLRRLCISWVNLDDDLIENIFSGTPQLETLVLSYCYGYTRLDITSKSVKNLVFSGYIDPNHDYDSSIIKINAPNILSLAIRDELLLGKLLLVNVTSLVKANLDYTNWKRMPKEAEEGMLKGLILNLSHVEDLQIWASCSKVLSRLEAKGFIFPLNMKF